MCVCHIKGLEHNTLLLGTVLIVDECDGQTDRQTNVQHYHSTTLVSDCHVATCHVWFTVNADSEKKMSVDEEAECCPPSTAM